MIKIILLITGLVVIIGLLIFGAVNRTLAKNEGEALGQGGNQRPGEAWSVSGATSGDENQVRHGGQASNGSNGQGELSSLPPAQPGELNAAEAEALLYMREEEKLAHDVYINLYNQWGLNTFQNIAGSEQAHTEAVKALLNRYGLDDPASADTGVFTNINLQALYDQLIARGAQSLAEAIKVGAAVEEIDLLDLEERIRQTEKADIQQVFTNLLSGSKNHLRAFASVLQAQTGETYQPQYLSLETYESFLEDTRGGNNQRGNAAGEYNRGGQRGSGRRGQGGQGRGASGAQP